MLKKYVIFIITSYHKKNQIQMNQTSKWKVNLKAFGKKKEMRVYIQSYSREVFLKYDIKGTNNKGKTGKLNYIKMTKFSSKDT